MPAEEKRAARRDRHAAAWSTRSNSSNAWRTSGKDDGQLAEHARRLGALAGEEEGHRRAGPGGLGLEKNAAGIVERWLCPGRWPLCASRSFSRRSSCDVATMARRASPVESGLAARLSQARMSACDRSQRWGLAPPAERERELVELLGERLATIRLARPEARRANRGSRPTARTRRSGRRPRVRHGNWCRRSRRR